MIVVIRVLCVMPLVQMVVAYSSIRPYLPMHALVNAHIVLIAVAVNPPALP